MPRTLMPLLAKAHFLATASLLSSIPFILCHPPCYGGTDGVEADTSGWLIELLVLTTTPPATAGWAA